MGHSRRFKRLKTRSCFPDATAGLSILLMALFNGNADSWFHINLSQIDVVAGVLFIIGFILLRKFKANPIYIMLGSGAVGLICYQFI